MTTTKAPKIRATHIEIAVANFFGIRQNLIVPNVSWGFGINYEADLVIIRKSGFAAEVEVKVDRQDLRNDSKKRKWLFNRPTTIKQFFFAVPESLLELCIEVAPPMAGIIVVYTTGAVTPFRYYQGMVEIIRPAKVNKFARRLRPDEIANLQRLAAIRIWGLKEKLINA